MTGQLDISPAERAALHELHAMLAACMVREPVARRDARARLKYNITLADAAKLSLFDLLIACHEENAP
ncbi:MAG: hypothetical protein ACLQME_20325 [Alphaproteobacteria bacterium]